MSEVLIVDDEVKYAAILARVLSGEGHSVEVAHTAGEALEKARARVFDVVVSDVRMPGMDGVELARCLREATPESDLVLMTAYATVETAVAALRLGVRDYLLKPFRNQELVAAVNRLAHARDLEAENEHLRASAAGEEPVGSGPAFQRALQEARRLAASDITVLLRGETGTGKEVFARFLHRQSGRASHPFMALNVAALPKDLLEAELFGYEKGAFTGADRSRPGKLEAAGRGTLFLDEIGELPPELQVKLLRVLEAREFRRVGSVRLRSFPARILAATHRDLETAVRQGSFREDLYFRIAVAELELPPLRDRLEDLEALARSLLSRLGLGHLQIDPATWDLLRTYRWPGNVRELANVLQRSAVMAESGRIGPEQVLLRVPAMSRRESSGPAVAGEGGSSETPRLPAAGPVAGTFPEHFRLEEWELAWVRAALDRAGGVKTEAARLLGISRRQLDSRMRRLEEEGPSG